MTPKPRVRTAAEMMSEMRLQAAASVMPVRVMSCSVTPVRVMSCTRAEQREAACDSQAEGESSGRDDERAEAAGGSKRQARQGDELHVRRAARGSLCHPSRGRERRPR